MRIRIEAIDTLFFKDGKPFDMGEETWADGMFPPSASVLAGAIRTVWFGENPDKIPLAATDDDPTRGLIIDSIALVVYDEICFNTPLDLVYDKKEKAKQQNLVPLKLKENSSPSNSAFKYLLAYEGRSKVEPATGGILDSYNMTNYLNDKSDPLNFMQLSDCLVSEPKTGIGREDFTRSADEGKLYRVGMRRPAVYLKGEGEKRLSIVVEFSGLDIPSDGLMKLGGEGKVAKYSIFNRDILPKKPAIDSKKDFFVRLMLITPGIFEHGSLPSLESVLPDSAAGRYEIIAAVTGKPLHVGGFDMQKRHPKPLKKAVPAGSAYYLKVEESCINDILSLHGKSISPDPYASLGYGIVLTGVKYA